MEQYDIDLKKFQSVVDLMASLMNVPAGLIMRIQGEFIEVIASSNTLENPYKVGYKEELFDSGLYCETVIKSNSMLLVPNALNDEVWKNNPDVGLGMISYLGLPINLPSGDSFGTICVLNNKEDNYCDKYIKLLTEFRDLIEDHFRIIDYKIRDTQIETWKATVCTFMGLVNNTMNRMLPFQMKMEKSDDFTEEDLQLFEKLLRECGNELRIMSEAEDVRICRKSFGNFMEY